MPYRPVSHRPPGYKSAEERKQESDKLRPSSYKRGYGRRWQAARSVFLAEHPLCVICKASGQLIEATIVDHITPHKGDYDLFWQRANWQSLCKRCHDHKTATEDGGFGR